MTHEPRFRNCVFNNRFDSLVSDIFFMDCVEGMKQYGDNYFDLAVVDPNYGIKANHNMGRRKGDKKSKHKPITWDNEPPPLEYFKELFRVSKNQVVWGANHFISRMPFDSSCWLLWDKKFSSEVSFAQFEMAWTSFDITTKKFDQSPNTGEVKIHPTQKPVVLYNWIFDMFAKKGDKILDTHLGSGSSRISAYLYECDFIGFEIDAEHIVSSDIRFKKQVSQQSMFSIYD